MSAIFCGSTCDGYMVKTEFLPRMADVPSSHCFTGKKKHWVLQTSTACIKCLIYSAQLKRGERRAK